MFKFLSYWLMSNVANPMIWKVELFKATFWIHLANFEALSILRTLHLNEEEQIYCQACVSWTTLKIPW